MSEYEVYNTFAFGPEGWYAVCAYGDCLHADVPWDASGPMARILPGEPITIEEFDGGEAIRIYHPDCFVAYAAVAGDA